MKVIILAAGIGSRLGNSDPKPLTKLKNGESILFRQVEYLSEYIGINNIITVVGYKKILIMESFPNLMFVYNNYYDTKIISTLTAASTDSVVELESDGSRIRKLDKTQQSNAYIRIKKLELEQLQNMITQYKLSSTSPLQVAGDDSIEGVYSRTTEFNRIKYQ